MPYDTKDYVPSERSLVYLTTGYGVQGKHLVPRLQALGHDLAYFAFYGLQNGVLNINGVPIYPSGTQMWGQDVISAHMAHFKADLLISLMDRSATAHRSSVSVQRRSIFRRLKPLI